MILSFVSVAQLASLRESKLKRLRAVLVGVERIDMKRATCLAASLLSASQECLAQLDLHFAAVGATPAQLVSVSSKDVVVNVTAPPFIETVVRSLRPSTISSLNRLVARHNSAPRRRVQPTIQQQQQQPPQQRQRSIYQIKGALFPYTTSDPALVGDAVFPNSALKRQMTAKRSQLFFLIFLCIIIY